MLNTNTVYYVEADAEILDLSTSEWIPVHEMTGTTPETYHEDALLVLPEFFMVTDGETTLILEEPGKFEIIEAYWTGINGKVYGVSSKFLT